MKNKDHIWPYRREHHPNISIGIFFVVLGVALLIATNDLLHLGGVSEYFRWETAMIFVGVILFLNLRFIGGLLMMAGGFWFYMEHFSWQISGVLRTIYWPAVIMLIGVAFIISSFFRRSGKEN